IRVPAGEVALVGAVVAVIAGDGATASPQPAAAAPAAAPKSAPPPQQTPFVPAQAGTQSLALDSRLRGNERMSDAVSRQPSGPMDPFFEVRTPARNYGPAKLPGGAF